ncbi:hypothetical protein HDU79_004754 [Rhizoclosmatium sp. JEL0117]|nr:hypothetical protein HDU79_004754 [Rhizoclosmatium sp. JEL0117]
MKVLAVCITSSAPSDFEACLSKVASMHSKHNFDLAVATGDFFGALAASPELCVRFVSGEISVPLPLYIATGQTAPPSKLAHLIRSNGEAAPNVFVLGDVQSESGVFETADGLRIAFGETVAENSSTKTKVADLFVAAAFPLAAASLSVLAEAKGITPSVGSPAVAAAAKGIRPRYLVCPSPSPSFLEREPFRNDNNSTTRLVALAAFPPAPSKSKERWFYAFNITPAKHMDSAALAVIPENATLSPFAALPSITSLPSSNARGTKRSAEGAEGNFFWGGGGFGPDAKKKSSSSSAPPSHYVCHACKQPGHWIADCPARQAPRGTPSGPPPDDYVCNICKEKGHYISACPSKAAKRQHLDRDPSTCWFCLSSPNIEKHLLIDIKDECYIASSKGGLSEWGGHLLIVPIQHVASRSEVLTEEALLQEITDCQTLIRQKFIEKRNAEEVPVFVEVFGGIPQGDAVRRVQHMHIQVVPVPTDISKTLRQTFLDAAGSAGLVAMPEGMLPADPATPYVRIEVEEMGDGIEPPLVLTMPVNGDPRAFFNLQFARRVLADVLGCPEKANWKNCTVSTQEEGKLTKEMKKFLA